MGTLDDVRRHLGDEGERGTGLGTGDSYGTVPESAGMEFVSGEME
jgi:hypothetical protein